MSGSSFADPSMPTIRDALKSLDSRSHIPVRKKQRWRQDALKACEWFNESPDELIAHPSNLNPRFRRVTRGTHGVGPKRLSNVKHSVKCLLACLPSKPRRSFKAELTLPWKKLAALVHDHYRLVSVLCLMQFASAEDILPENFDDAASERLLSALINDRLNGRPRVTHQNAVRSWNWLKARVVGWPTTKLTPKRYNENYILPWSALPPWVEVACHRYVERNATTDAFDLSRPMKVWRPHTRRTYLTLLRRFMSMLVHAGRDLSGTRSLQDVATFEMAELGLRWMLQRSQNRRGKVMAANIAILLAQIALNPDGKAMLTDIEKTANAAVAEKLQALANRLRSEPGLSTKTRDRLVPLKDEANLARLFLLPFGIERELGQSRKNGRFLALQVQWAVALMILTFCPLRVSTLCRISDQNLVWSQRGRRGELSLELDGSTLKNGEPASIPLPTECARLVRLYVDKYRHFLATDDTQFLFPSTAANNSKLPATMSTQLSRLIRARTGFDVHPHLYRHLVHLVILRRFPGAYTMISRVLTHKSLETALRNYAYFDTELSMKAFHQLVRDVQDGTAVKKATSVTSIAYNQMEFDHGSR